MKKLMLSILLTLFAIPAHVQVTSTRETAYDYACCDDQACATKTNHQRLDVAFTACLNRSLVDGAARWVQGGRWRVAVSLPRPPDNPFIPPTSATATLSWEAPTTRTDGSPLTNLAGYRIRYGNAIGNYPWQVSVPNPGVTTYEVTALTSGTWYFVLASYDAAGLESANTNPVSKTFP